MDMRIQGKQNRRQGFTLVELLLVLVILGVLAAIVILTATVLYDPKAEKLKV